MTLYALPIVGRAGLCNMLFPWARAELFARRHEAHVLKPSWAAFRIGPFVRNEPEKRLYLGFFHARNHIRGLKRLALLASAPRFSEADCEHDQLPPQGAVVEFRGLRDYFMPILADYSFIRNALWNMTVPQLRDHGRQYGGYYIAMHVRRGDFTRQGLSEHQLGKVPAFTSIGWFEFMAGALRRTLRSDTPIVVFTDGSEDEMAPLRRFENVHLRKRQPAITDLWALSHARALVATGYSTFSMWASYLGGMPTFYAPGKIQQLVQTGRPSGLEIEIGTDGDIPVAALEEACAPGAEHKTGK